nr:MAG TPA: hypothetical protein [Caudoviricetes sp.]
MIKEKPCCSMVSSRVILFESRDWEYQAFFRVIL